MLASRPGAPLEGPRSLRAAERARPKKLDDYLPKVGKAAPANRSYRRLTNLAATQAFEAANVKRWRRADSIRARGRNRKPH